MPRIYSQRKDAQAKDPIPQGAIYVGRPSRYGNPYEMSSESQRDWACDMFETYARIKLSDNPQWLDQLWGHDLVCWCQHPSQRNKRRCHAETLLKLIEELYGNG